jgi:FkbM family methyltransferase
MSSADRSSHLRSHYTIRHRLIATVSRMFDGYVYTMRRGLAKGLKRKGGLGFVPNWIARGTHDTPETRFLLGLDLRDKVVFDIGGFQGLLTMFFATRAKSVVVYEPNPESRARLQDNLALNAIRNVTVRPVGVGAQEGEFELVFDPLMAGGASADAKVAGQIRETAGHLRVERIRVVSVDDDIAESRLPIPAFVKIDVEGMELEVLRGMRRLLRSARPALYIEMHGATLDEKRANARRVLEELAASGYGDVTHVETGSRVTPQTADVAARGHLYCRAG